MELVAAVEAEFGVRFPLYLLPDLTTIPAVVAAVAAHSPTN
jgi:acyl carrier protein